jgi:GNAT superfamily N-acetyltransferase
MIRKAEPSDYNDIYRVINEAARIYEGVIPADRWKWPYMPMEELTHEINDGVDFWIFKPENILLGVMGIQDRGDVTLIRHAYVLESFRKQGIGTSLLKHLTALSIKPILIGTWERAVWAVRFYEKNGFRTVSPAEKDLLLKKYWKIPERQIETSVVLGDENYRKNLPSSGEMNSRSDC